MASGGKVEEVLFKFTCGYERILTNDELSRLENLENPVLCNHPKKPKCKGLIQRENGIPVKRQTGR